MLLWPFRTSWRHPKGGTGVGPRGRGRPGHSRCKGRSTRPLRRSSIVDNGCGRGVMGMNHLCLSAVWVQFRFCGRNCRWGAECRSHVLSVDLEFSIVSLRNVVAGHVLQSGRRRGSRALVRGEGPFLCISIKPHRTDLRGTYTTTPVVTSCRSANTNLFLSLVKPLVRATESGH